MLMLFFTERVRNKSTEKKSGIQLGFEPKTFLNTSQDTLTINPLGGLAEERKTSYISSVA